MGRPRKIKPKIIIRTFEECLPEIEDAINKRKHRWSLTALAWLDFDDVRQILKFHIWKKFHLYDQNRPLSSWLTVVINNHMINLIRNVYSNYSRPCLKCEFYNGDDLCTKFNVVSTKCDLFRTWTYGKKTKYNIQLSLPIENHENEVHEIAANDINVDKTAQNIHERMKKILKPLELQVYELLYVKKLDESEAARILKFKSNEKGRHPGYGRLGQIKKIIIAKVREELLNEDIEIVQ